MVMSTRPVTSRISPATGIPLPGLAPNEIDELKKTFPIQRALSSQLRPRQQSFANSARPGNGDEATLGQFDVTYMVSPGKTECPYESTPVDSAQNQHRKPGTE